MHRLRITFFCIEGPIFPAKRAFSNCQRRLSARSFRWLARHVLASRTDPATDQDRRSGPQAQGRAVMGKRRLGAALGVGRPRFPGDNVIATARASRRRWSRSGFRPCRRPHRPPRDGTPRALRRRHGESGPFGETGGEWVVDWRRPCQDNRFGQPRGGNAASWVVGARHAARTGGSSDPETSGC